MNQLTARAIILRKNVSYTLKVLLNITAFVSALVTIITALVAVGLFAWFQNHNTLLYSTISFAIGSFAVLFIGIIVFARSSSALRSIRGYRWVSAEYEYVIWPDEPHHHTQTVTIQLEAIRPGVDHFENRYLWTGHGSEDPPKVLSHGHSLMGPVIRRSAWYYYYVHLGHELSIGDRVEIKVSQDLLDIEGTFEPFLAKTVLEPVDSLTLRVILPTNDLPRDAAFSEQLGPAPSNSVVKKETLRVNTQTGVIQKEISSPVFGRRYELRWPA